MPNLTLREMPELVPLLRDLHTYHVANKPALFHADASSGALLAFLETQEKSGSWFFGHRVDGKLRAYLMAVPERHPRDSFRKRHVRVLLDHLYVTPELRGTGVAQALVQELETRMKAEAIAEWCVKHHAFNARAARFFARMGGSPAVIHLSRTVGD